MDLQYLIYLIYLGESVIFHHPKTIIIRNPKHTFHGLYLDTRLSIVPQDLGRMEHMMHHLLETVGLSSA